MADIGNAGLTFPYRTTRSIGRFPADWLQGRQEQVEAPNMVGSPSTGTQVPYGAEPCANAKPFGD
jgi:hypothetical protein